MDIWWTSWQCWEGFISAIRHLYGWQPIHLFPYPQIGGFSQGKLCVHFSRVAVKINSSNKTANQFFQKMIGTYDCFGNPIIAGQLYIIPWFQPKFFEDSPALLQGFQKLVFSHGLDYAYSSLSLPNQVSCWHFLSSLD